METSVFLFFGLLATIIILSTRALRLTRNPHPTTNKPIHPPSPPALPVAGHLHLLKQPLHRTLESLSRRYGPVFSLRLGCCRLLVVSSPSAAEECFNQNDVIFANRPRFISGELKGYNYTTVGWAGYGELWRNLRRVMAVKALSSDRLLNTARIREEEVRLVARKLLAGPSPRVDIHEAFFEVTRNVMMRLVVGKRWATTGVNNDLFVPSEFMTVYDYFPVLRWFGYGGLEKKIRARSMNRDRFFQGLLDEARKEMKAGGETRTTSSSMVEELLAVQKAEPEYYTDDILKGIIMLMLTAGADTSARTMELVISLLLNHPSTFDKARAEIDTHIGTTRLVDDSDLSSLPFLHCVVNETLRLVPISPLLIPHCSSADTTIAGYHVPKNTVLYVNAWAIHRDPNVWEDPLAFKPERFEAVDAGSGFKFIPFGIGRRACPGTNLAMRMMMLALATWIQCFEFESEEGGMVDMEEMGSGGTTITKTQHLHVVCKPRGCMVDLLSQV